MTRQLPRKLLRGAIGLAALFALPVPAPAQDLGAWPSAPLRADTLRVVHLLQRATYGARPEDIARASRVGPAAWIDAQLRPETIDDAALERRLRRFPTVTLTPGALFEAYPPTHHAYRMTGAGAPAERDVPPPGEIAVHLTEAKLERAVFSRRQLLEVMTDFWFNHLNVDFGKGQTKWLVADYESRAIRPHVFGRFEELLIASATHPAMLIYLDNRMNFASDAPQSAMGAGRSAAVAAGGRRGINENYARELLELHTLGVDGGYGQGDVIEVARAFTGWTVVGITDREALDESFHAVAFAFRDELHDPGAKTILGQELSGGGVEEGYAVLRMLARHPATARRVATKLVQAFASDDAPPDLIDEVAETFLATDGDLAAVTRALFTSPRFYDPAVVGSKVKSPFELVASALRLSEAEVSRSDDLVEALHALGHAPYVESAPTGYPETNGEWLNAGALVQRIELALALAGGEVRGVRLDPLALARSGRARDPAAALARRLVPGTDTAALEAVVRDEIAGIADFEARARTALGLILGSLEFQRH